MAEVNPRRRIWGPAELAAAGMTREDDDSAGFVVTDGGDSATPGGDLESDGTFDAPPVGIDVAVPVGALVPVATPWKVHSGTWLNGGGVIEADAVGAGSPSAVMSYGENLRVADIEVETVAASVPGTQGVFLRGAWDAVFGLSGYLLRFNGANVRIQRFDLGASTLLVSLGVATGAGDRIRLVCWGKHLWAYHNGVKVIATTDTTYTIGRIGLASNTAGATVSAFRYWRV